MYEIIFTNNFYLNFLNSLLFISFNVFFSYKLHQNLLEKKLISIQISSPLIILFVVFTFISIFFNFLILTNNYQYFRHVLMGILFFQLIYLIKFVDLPKKINFKLIKTDKIELFIIFILTILYLISILPISDADSIALHQNLSNEIYFRGLENLDIEKNLSFTIFSNTQNLLIISPILNSDNFGAQLNIIVLIIFYFFTFRDKKNFILILLASPLIIYFISTQKLQLFFGILYLLIFIIVNEKLIKTKLDLFLTIFLLIFYASGNISYILFATPIFIYLLFQQKQNWKNLFFYSFVSFLLILLPILVIKQVYFQNFLAPFFDNIIGTNNLLFNAYSNSVRSTGGWLDNPANLELYLKPFISFDVSSFTSSLGIIFLLMLFNIKLQSKLKYFPLIIILLVISTGQILPRYYLEAFLILAYYFNINNILSKIIISSHNFLIIIISLGYIYFSYYELNVVQNKTEYMKKFSYSYFNSLEQKKNRLDANILDTVGRPSTFFEQNIFSKRTLNIIKQYKNNDEYFAKFIRNNSIKYIVKHKSDNLPSCLNLEKIGETKRKLAVRNFLRKNKAQSNDILIIKSNNC